MKENLENVRMQVQRALNAVVPVELYAQKAIANNLRKDYNMRDESLKKV